MVPWKERLGRCAKCGHRKAHDKSWPYCPTCWRRFRCPRCNVLCINGPRRTLCPPCMRETGSDKLPNRRWLGNPCPAKELPFREAYYASRAAQRLPLFEGAPWMTPQSPFKRDHAPFHPVPFETFVCAYCHCSYAALEGDPKNCCHDCVPEAFTDVELARLFPLKIGEARETRVHVSNWKLQRTDESYGRAPG